MTSFPVQGLSAFWRQRPFRTSQRWLQRKECAFCVYLELVKVHTRVADKGLSTAIKTANINLKNFYKVYRGVLWTIIARKQQISKFYSEINFGTVVHNTPAQLNWLIYYYRLWNSVERFKSYNCAGNFRSEFPTAFSLKVNLGSFVYTVQILCQAHSIGLLVRKTGWSVKLISLGFFRFVQINII